MIADIDLLQAYWLFLLPFPWLWLYWRLRHPVSWPPMRPMMIMRYPLLDDLHSIKETKTGKKQGYQRDSAMAVALSFMILALAQPVHYSAYAEPEALSEPVDVILVVDTALSMSLSDYEIEGQAVSRMGMSRLSLKTFIKDYSGRRMGLVILGNPPALWLPLTTDKAVMQDAISRITTLLGGRITDMGATLNLVREQFNDQQEKVVVLISDGGTQIGSVSPQEAAQELVSAGFTLYVVAVGSSDPDAGSLDKSSLIYEAANLPMLQQVADRGNGILFHALDSQAFSDALKTIENKHRKPLQIKEKQKLAQAWYPLPLAIAMLVLLYAALLKQDTMARQSRFESARFESDSEVEK